MTTVSAAAIADSADIGHHFDRGRLWRAVTR
jgi:hypothetical protein